MLGLAPSIALLLVQATAPPLPPPPPRLPGWMAGCWVEEKGEAWTEECWTAARANSMLGSGRSGRGTSLRNWETMQIFIDQPNGDGPAVRMGLWGAPRGQNRTLFAASSWTATEVVFTNAAHDYPQRIRYWREGAMLNAETSLMDGSKAMRWSYRRQG